MLTYPEDGSVLFHLETLIAELTGTGVVDRVEFLVGGTTVGADQSAPYQVEVDTTSVADEPPRV